MQKDLLRTESLTKARLNRFSRLDNAKDKQASKSRSKQRASRGLSQKIPQQSAFGTAGCVDSDNFTKVKVEQFLDQEIPLNSKKTRKQKQRSSTCKRATQLPVCPAVPQVLVKRDEKCIYRSQTKLVQIKNADDNKSPQSLKNEKKDNLKPRKKKKVVRFESDEHTEIAFNFGAQKISAVENAKFKVFKDIQEEPLTETNKKGSKTRAKRSKPLEKKQMLQGFNERPDTMNEMFFQNDKQVKDALRGQITDFQKSQALPKESYVADEFKKLLSSYHFKKELEKRRIFELQKLIKVNDDYTEIIYDKREHHKKLNGIFSRQFAPSFFEDAESEKLNDLLENLNEQVMSDCSNSYKRKVKERLLNSNNQLLVLFDSRSSSATDQKDSKESVAQSQEYKDLRIIGFTIFQETDFENAPGMFAHYLVPKNRKKGYKKKILLALRVSQERFRAEEISIAVNNRDLKLYKKLGFIPTTISQGDMDSIEIVNKKKKQMMSLQTQQSKRDIKKAIKIQNQGLLSRKAQNLQIGIEYMKQWLFYNRKEVESKISRRVKCKAMDSDQAQTPKWLMTKIKRFTHLSDDEIIDAFVYQRFWTSKAFFDGYKKPWDPKKFYYVNSPFTQIVAALLKCADHQANGGNCAMILPSICLKSSLLYENCLQFTTIKTDLKLFPFDGFKNDLMKHIVVLYFLQPDFLNQIMKKNNPKPIQNIVFKNDDDTILRISKFPKAQKVGRKKRDLTEFEKKQIVEQYKDGKGVDGIRKSLKRRFATVREYLQTELGDDQLEREQESRIKTRKSNYPEYVY